MEYMVSPLNVLVITVIVCGILLLLEIIVQLVENSLGIKKDNTRKKDYILYLFGII